MKNGFDNTLTTLLERVGDMALKRRARRIIEELDLKKGEKVLDCGCGDGFYLHLLSELPLSLKITGADFDKNALKSAKKNLQGKKIPLFQADLMRRLPFKSNSFNKIIMTEVAEHLPDDVKGLKEVYRVLKKGGTLVLTVPNHNYPLFWDPVNKILESVTGNHIKQGFWAGIWNQHIRLYYPKDIVRVLKKAGFSIELVESVTHYSFPFNHNLLHLAARFLYGGTASTQVVEEISKFSAPKKRRLSLVTIAFSFVNFVDRLNNGVTDKSSVSVLVKAKK